MSECIVYKRQPIKNYGKYWICCLCHRRFHLRRTRSHNALPLKDGRCCRVCNLTKVIPQRWIDLVDAK